MKNIFLLLFSFVLFTHSCVPVESKSEKLELSEKQQNTWFSGKAEINHFKTKRMRYGEVREGHLDMIFVSETFDKKTRVKSNKQGDTAGIQVLKMIRIEDFQTGVYPYHLYTTSFNELFNPQRLIKATHSMDEWCGQSFSSLNCMDDHYSWSSNSYRHQNMQKILPLSMAYYEDGLWNMIRLLPDSLPTGEIMIMPSLESVNFEKTGAGLYTAQASLQQSDSSYTYTLRFLENKRQLIIEFGLGDAHEILSWAEYDGKSEEITFSAHLERSYMLDYWNKKSKKDEVLY